MVTRFMATSFAATSCMAARSVMKASKPLWQSSVTDDRRLPSGERSMAMLTGALLILVGLQADIATAQQSQPSKPQPVADRAADIEERLIDLQVQVATMHSLAANTTSVATAVSAPQTVQIAFAQSVTSQNIAASEAELAALAAQLQQLSGRPPAILPAGTTARLPAAAMLETVPAQSFSPQQGETGRSDGWFGSTTVTPNKDATETGQSSEILPQNVFPGGAGAQSALPQSNAVAGWSPLQSPSQSLSVGADQVRPPASTFQAPGTGGAASGAAEMEYQTAYGYLLQQDYGAAETAFTEFVAKYPSISLAGNAQYWIGETHYVRGAYKAAAVAFLEGFEKYGDGNKGPDSLLKLALSLGRLNQVPAACSSLRELGDRYGAAPAGLLERGKEEMRRLKCPA